jgi:hypothetical protein
MSTAKETVCYSLILLILGCMIYVSFNWKTHKLIGIKSVNIETYSTADDSKKSSKSFRLNYFNNVNSIPGTTGPGIPNIIRSTLSTKYGPVNESSTSFYGAGSGMYLFLRIFYQMISCLLHVLVY